MEFRESFICFLQLWILLGFFPYSLILVLLRRSKRISSVFLDEFDEVANKVIIYSGLLLAALLCIDFFEWIREMDYERRAFADRLFPLWMLVFSGQIVAILLVTQLLRFKIIRDQIWYRVFVSAVGIVSSEKLFRMIVSYNDRYLPSSWVWYMGPADYLNAFVQSTVSIIAVSALVYFVRRWMLRISLLKRRT